MCVLKAGHRKFKPLPRPNIEPHVTEQSSCTPSSYSRKKIKWKIKWNEKKTTKQKKKKPEDAFLERERRK